MKNNRLPSLIFGLLSIVICLFLAWLTYWAPAATTIPNWMQAIPKFNAAMNGISLLFMLRGISAILKKDIVTHKRSMFSALISSTFFVVGYVLYNTYVGHTPYAGEGLLRLIYFVILISHIALTVVALPMILMTVFLGLKDDRPTHKRLARYTFPIWAYISITGILIYLLR
ncbi:DUF420 domain-containing protein [bacterium]|jgi:putative membrane protein|nr:DUF420 domain-containing protein [bacterium]